MNIHHEPILNRTEIIRKYTEAEGVVISYVCTSELKISDKPMDVFYRETPHPFFGNKYFGLYYRPPLISDSGIVIEAEEVYITNADYIEEVEFGMVKDENGVFQYSQFRHDYRTFNNGAMIDGGRAYIRSSTHAITVFKVKDGKFILKEGGE